MVGEKGQKRANERKVHVNGEEGIGFVMTQVFPAFPRNHFTVGFKLGEGTRSRRKR